MANNKRFIPPRIRGKRLDAKISHDEITRAIQAFESKGGWIRQLPPQDFDRPPSVGNRWESMYESVIDRG